MKTQRIYYLIGILIVIASIGWFTVANWNDSRKKPAQDSSSVQSIKGWEVLTTNAYSLSYPQEAKAENRDNGSVIFFMGPKQIASGRTQTELFDGYSFRIETVSPLNKPLGTLAKEERDNAQANCQEKGGAVSQLQSVTIAGQESLQYSANGCYIDYTETFVAFKDGIFRISQSYAGDKADQEKYKEITSQILSSLKF